MSVLLLGLHWSAIEPEAPETWGVGKGRERIFGVLTIALPVETFSVFWLVDLSGFARPSFERYEAEVTFSFTLEVVAEQNWHTLSFGLVFSAVFKDRRSIQYHGSKYWNLLQDPIVIIQTCFDVCALLAVGRRVGVGDDQMPVEAGKNRVSNVFQTRIRGWSDGYWKDRGIDGQCEGSLLVDHGGLLPSAPCESQP